jgi:Uma2 family endonuclease
MATNVQVPEVDFNSIDTSRFEYVDGQLVERPVPKDRHAEVQGNIVELLGPKARHIGLRAYPELTVDKEDIPKPQWMTADVVITKPDFTRTQRHNALPPLLLAIEIMSPGQTMPQMMKKANDYLEWGVENVWIINPEQESAVMVRSGQERHPILVWSGFDLGVEYGEVSLSIPLVDLLT